MTYRPRIRSLTLGESSRDDTKFIAAADEAHLEDGETMRAVDRTSLDFEEAMVDGRDSQTPLILEECA